MDPAQLKKFGLVILGLGLIAIILYLVWTDDKIHLYIGAGAGVLGLILAGVGFVKK